MNDKNWFAKDSLVKDELRTFCKKLQDKKGLTEEKAIELIREEYPSIKANELI